MSPVQDARDPGKEKGIDMRWDIDVRELTKENRPVEVILCILFTIVPFAFPGEYSGGAGTVTDPYRIGTVDDWKKLTEASDDWGKYFLLLNDIDFAGIELTPISEIRGVFDGQGKVLRNAVIHLPNQRYVGLFRRVFGGAQIRDLGVEAVTVTGYEQVGGLAGINFGTINHCFVTGTITATSSLVADCGGLVGWNETTLINCHAACIVRGSAGCVGGLAGYNYGTITGSFAISDISSSGDSAYSIGGCVGHNAGGILDRCSAEGVVNGIGWVGGLAGKNTGSISRCYARGIVEGVSYTGGLVGYNVYSVSMIANCYASCTVNCYYYLAAGGLVGHNENGSILHCYSTSHTVKYPHVIGGLCGWNESGTVADSFWDMETSGQSSSDGGEGKTATEMKTTGTYMRAGWDLVGETVNGIEDSWRMCSDPNFPGSEYPRLSWEFSNAGDFTCPDNTGIEDLVYLSLQWLAQMPEGVGAVDTDGNGKVDLADWVILSENWGRSKIMN